MSQKQKHNQTQHYDLCIVGAGIGGLNALHVASQYLRADQRVLLVDRHDRVGGMWVKTYDYVRLHQPHPFFTAGDVKWTFGKKASHLASKTEVLDHFQHCVSEAKKRVGVTELFGHEMESIDEVGDAVQVTCRSADGTEMTITADHVINAAALDIAALQPLALTSDRVRSVSPETCDMRTGEIAENDDPVWIIGSGKTAMDTALALMTAKPGREINMIAGSGTFFGRREQFFPTGAKRWWGGTRFNQLLAEIADRFDGTNEHDVLAWYRGTYGTWATPRAEHHLVGLMSETESERIRSGLGEVVMGHLDDAADIGDGVMLTLRAGEPIVVQPGSWVVNCTSHFGNHTNEPSVPYVSASGRVVTIGRSGIFGFTSFGGYFLTHLLYAGKILDVPLLEIKEPEVLLHTSSPAAIVGVLVLAQHNIGIAFDHLPTKVFQDGFGLDFDRWFPAPRRMVGQLRFMARRKRRGEHCRQALETLGDRFGVTIGPVVGVG
ncbi:MAG: FAD-dependent oxidoreductase [Aeromicrobium sp.]|uniref:FAD-dependent oxidoreductase n=1 Tax=Aeromicrobium sp. TaxID=1871063 RepID=UPI003C504E1F